VDEGLENEAFPQLTAASIVNAVKKSQIFILSISKLNFDIKNNEHLTKVKSTETE